MLPKLIRWLCLYVSLFVCLSIRLSVHLRVCHIYTFINAKSELTKCFFCQKILSTSEEYFRHATKAHQVICYCLSVHLSVCFYVHLTVCLFSTSNNAKLELTKCFFCQKLLSTSEDYFRHATKAHGVICYCLSVFMSLCPFVCLSYLNLHQRQVGTHKMLLLPKDPFNLRRVFQTRYQSSWGNLLLPFCFYVSLSICLFVLFKPPPMLSRNSQNASSAKRSFQPPKSISDTLPKLTKWLYLYVCLLMCVSVCLLVYLSVCPFLSLSISQSVFFVSSAKRSFQPPKSISDTLPKLTRWLFLSICLSDRPTIHFSLHIFKSELDSNESWLP